MNTSTSNKNIYIIAAVVAIVVGLLAFTFTQKIQPQLDGIEKVGGIELKPNIDAGYCAWLLD